jgi:hypothetical protein
MAPHGRMHCNDLKVRAPSSRAADPTMMVRDWPATSEKVATTSLARARRFDGIEESSHPGGCKFPSWHPEGAFINCCGGAGLRGVARPGGRGAEDESGRSQHTGCQVAWSTLRCPRLSKLAYIRRSGRPKPIDVIVARSDTGLCFSPPEDGLTDSILCLLPRGERVLCAGCARIPGPNASITGALASQCIDSRALQLWGLQATVPLTASLHRRSAATGRSAAATLTS